MGGEHEATAAACADCGTALAGPYCHACGQRAHLHRSLLHFGEELAHGILHFDAKGWRTLPLLVARPGLLTRRYIDGQRTRHVSPLALFLFCVFLMFFVFSLTGASPKTPGMLDEDESRQARAELQADLERARTELAQAEKALAQAQARRSDVAEAEAEAATARRNVQIEEAALATFDATVRAAASAASAASGVQQAAPAASGNGFMQAAARVDTGSAALDAKIRKQLENPELALYKLKSAASKFSFLLVPISLPFLWLMFLGRRDIVLYDHAVFALYSLSFMALLFTVVAALSAAVPKASFAWLAVLAPPVHMFLQLRGAYGLTTGGALWRTTAMLVVAGVVALIYLVLIAVVAA
jgi:hypothetical protein